MQEIELKFQIPAHALQAVEEEITSLQSGPSKPLRLRASYFDTPDRALAQANSAIRVRQEGRKWVQTLKSGGSNTMLRVEDNQTATAPKANEAVVADLSRHLGTPAETVLRTALKWDPEHDASGKETGLIELYRTDITRHHARLTVGAGTPYEGEVELALDLGYIHAGELSVPVRELEIESVSGHPMAVIEASRDWSLRHGLWLDTQTKAHRGDQLARQAARLTAHQVADQSEDAPSEHATLARPARLKDGGTLDQAWRAALESVLEHMSANMSELATAPSAIEHTTEQWRCSLRRLLALGKFMSKTKLAFPHAALKAAKKLDNDLMPWRDAQALAWLPSKMVKQGGPDLPLPAPDSSALRNHGAIVHLARSHLSTSLCLDLLAALLSPSDASAEGTQAHLPWIRKHLRRWHARCQTEAKVAKKLAPKALRQLSQRAERLYWMADLFSSMLHEKRQHPYAQRLSKALKRLSRHQDEATALTWYQQASVLDARAQWAQTWLQSRQAKGRRRAHRALQDWRKAKAPW